ncbi:hemerythrin domain-containing protein [Maritimibacter sp. DP1N21-5]|uniref:hemerythrin domain-containing protein n=1 Tax=Maritimibacter sp. DP1N21-5 TaxID=2836867 RepID=UPI001C47C3DD|nr:hemerythrin domain-containing protein [Maritimibacter sp. DP1N21-5]MBV7409094.1 hemerythrin domain-containing protein [Maritimibacter sp. DP1N21-5]
MNDDLSGRDGLPSELRVLADRYPRDMWEGHPNFPGLTAFWLEMHGKFRAVMNELITGSQSYLDGADPMRFGSATSRYTGFFLQGLQGHHGIEDHHYFPLMVEFDPRLVRAFDILDKDHHALHDHMNALADATNDVLRPLQSGAQVRDETGRLLEVQEAFRGFLDRHLTDEEDVIVPLILEHGQGRF